MEKEINPRDDNGKAHGYQKWYWSYNKIWLRCFMKHGEPIAYEEIHLKHGQSETNFYIK